MDVIQSIQEEQKGPTFPILLREIPSRSTSKWSRAIASVSRCLRESSSRGREAVLTETFTVRKISQGVGVERTFPVHSPKIDRIEVVRKGKVRQARLYYLRDRVGKAARIKERR